MTVHPIEHANQIAEFNASRDVQVDARNIERLVSWQRRYPHDVVPVPAASQPPTWPAERASIPKTATVTQIAAKRGRG